MEDFSELKKELAAVSNFVLSSIRDIQKSVYPKQFASGYGYMISYICDNEESNIFQRDIEREFRLNRSTVSNVLKELEKQGLVERKPVSTDARLKKVVATQGAKMINDACNREISNLLKKLFDGIDDSELEALKSTLSKIHANSREDK